MNGSNGTATIYDQSYGVAAGIDARIGGITIGGAFSAASLDTGVAARASTNKGTLYQGGGYAAYDNGQAYASLIGSYFSVDVDSTRQVYLGAAFQGTATGRSKVDGYTLGASGGLSYADRRRRAVHPAGQLRGDECHARCVHRNRRGPAQPRASPASAATCTPQRSKVV